MIFVICKALFVVLGFGCCLDRAVEMCVIVVSRRVRSRLNSREEALNCGVRLLRSLMAIL